MAHGLIQSSLKFGNVVSLTVLLTIHFIPGYLAQNLTGVNEGVLDGPYKGRLIGALQQLRKGEMPNQAPKFRVAGTLYAVDEQLLYLHQFIYDAAIADMFIWAISRRARTLKEDVFIVPTGNECAAGPTCAPLEAIWEENMMLALPLEITFNDVTEIAVGTRDKNVLFPKLKEKFASILLPKGFQHPQPVILPVRLGNSVIAGGVSSGQIIIQDSRRIFIEQVTFDGSASDAYFWVDRDFIPSPNGFMVAPNNDETPPEPLPRLPKEPLLRYDALLDLRRAFRPAKPLNVRFLTIFDLKCVAIYGRNYGTVFGDAPFDGADLKGKIPAALDDLSLQRMSAKAAKLLRDLNYQIGVDNGVQTRPLPVFPRPPSPYSRILVAATSSGEMLQDDPSVGFPALTMAKLYNHSWNCELIDDVLEVQWRVQAGYITITLSAVVANLPKAENSYLAFGISGSRNQTRMIGSDVTLGFMGDFGLHLGDFVLGAKLTCDLKNPSVNAVCPRKLIGGAQVSRLVGGGGIKDGKFSFSFRRPVKTPDVLGKDIALSRPVYIVWAAGPMNLTSNLPEYHTIHAKESTVIDFGRVPRNNCHGSAFLPSVQRSSAMLSRVT